MSAPDETTAAADGRTPAQRWSEVGPGVAVLVGTAASMFLRWPGDGTLPGGAALTAAAGAALAGALLLAAGRRRSGASHVAAWVGCLGAAVALPGGLGALDDIGRGGVGDSPAPVLLLAAAVLAAVAGVRSDRDGLRWFDPPAGPAPRRSATIGLVTATLALTVGTAGLRYAADDAGVDGARFGGAMTGVQVLADATSLAGARVTGVAPGEVRTAAGAYAVLEDTDRRAPSVRVVDARTGVEQWSEPGRWRRVEPTWAADGFLVVTDRGLALREASTGAERWRRQDLDVADVAGLEAGPAVLTDGDDAVVAVLDPATGATVRELRPTACPDGLRLMPGPVAVSLCRLASDRLSVEVLGQGPGGGPTWRGELEPGGYVDGVAPGVALVVPGGTAPDDTGILIDASSGSVLRTVAAGVRVAETRGHIVALVSPDGTVERWDADRRTTLGTATLDGGDGYDASEVVRVSWRLVGDRLVAARQDGFGAGDSPATQRRFGIVAWDAATGAQVERVTTGRQLADGDRTYADDPVLTDDAVVLAIGLDVSDGRRPAEEHGLFVSLRA